MIFFTTQLIPRVFSCLEFWMKIKTHVWGNYGSCIYIHDANYLHLWCHCSAVQNKTYAKWPLDGIKPHTTIWMWNLLSVPSWSSCSGYCRWYSCTHWNIKAFYSKWETQVCSDSPVQLRPRWSATIAIRTSVLSQGLWGPEPGSKEEQGANS